MTGTALGLALGLGLWLCWSRLPARRRPTLADRLAPYVRETGGLRLTAHERAGSPLTTLERLARPYLLAGADRLERILGGGTALRRRLDQSGSGLTLTQFRVEQVLWAAFGLGAGIVVSLLLLTPAGVDPTAMLVFCLSCTVAGVVAREQRLAYAVRKREDALLAELPTVADLLALSVAAGEGPLAALERVARVSSGALAAEVGRAVADTRTGVGLLGALDGIADRTSLPALARFVDGIAVAVERGTPLADVLRAQAGDVREAHRRQLLELGGRREIAMMVPVVFLVLPVTVVFALYPGFATINLAVT